MDASLTLHITYPRAVITSSTSPEWWGGCLDYVDQKMYLKRVGGSKWGQKSVGKFDIVH